MTGKNDKGRFAISRVWWKALLLAAVVIGVGVPLWMRGHTAPPDIDVRAEFAQLEQRIRDGRTEDPDVTRQLVEIGSELKRRMDEIESRWFDESGEYSAFAELVDSNDNLEDPVGFAPAVDYVREFLNSAERKSLSALAADPGFVPPSMAAANTTLFEVDPESFQSSMLIARVLVLSLDVVDPESQPSVYLANIRDAFAYGDYTQRHTSLVGSLVNTSIRASINYEILAQMRDVSIPDSLAQDLIDLLTASTADRPELHESLEGERLIMLDVLPTMYGLQTLEGGTEPSFREIYFDLVSHRRMANTINRFMDLAIERRRLPPQGRNARSQQLHTFADDLSAKYIAVHLLESMVNRALRHNDEVRCDTAGTVLMLAIQRFNARERRLPDSLDELVEAGLLDRLPSDPFASDRRFVYRQDLNAPLGYTLYSVGNDGKDNRGTPHDRFRAAQIGLTTEPGSDYVIEPPPPEQP